MPQAITTSANRIGIYNYRQLIEVNSDPTGKQTILCGLRQAGSLPCCDKIKFEGIKPAYAVKFIQKGWETITEALKYGGITTMMDHLSLVPLIIYGAKDAIFGFGIVDFPPMLFIAFLGWG